MGNIDNEDYWLIYELFLFKLNLLMIIQNRT